MERHGSLHLDAAYSDSGPPMTISCVTWSQLRPRVHSVDWAPELGTRSKSNRTCLRHLDIGDVGSPHDMIIAEGLITETANQISDMIHSLQKHDFVFLHRSDGSWTYAIIAERQEKYMRLVVDCKGGNKVIPRKRWLKSIRLVNIRTNREKMSYRLPPLREADHSEVIQHKILLPSRVTFQPQIPEGMEGRIIYSYRTDEVSDLSLFD